MSTVGWLTDAASDLTTFGGKGASLAALHRGGFHVPPGFCLLAPAYHRFVQANDLESLIASLLSVPSLNLPKVARDATATLAQALESATLPDDIIQVVSDAYDRLKLRVPDLVCAVRSSALSEDAAGASSAGLYDTFLNLRDLPAVNLRDLPAVLDSIVQCYRSLWTARAVQYRSFKKIDSAREAMAVVVMEMVPSEVSGVAFTVNPVTGDRDQIMINASWGLGEAIVSGRVSPDQFVLRKSDGMVLEREIQSKDAEILPNPNGSSGTIQLSIDPARATIPTLSDRHLLELGATCARIEAHYGRAMDIEWAFARGNLYVLQARPVTGL
nr:pyruvate phosphate dikinase, PEP/pyruvate binding domain protein [uncultured bacterium]